MLFLFSLITAILFVWIFQKPLKQHPTIFYIAAIAITGCTVLLDTIELPVWLENSFAGMLKRGSFSTALWIIIMMTGALKNGSRLMKLFMPIRGQLSIFAAIITLGHNLVYGKIYFVNLFTNISHMANTQILAAILTILMLLILIPLTITSFPSVRKKMKGASWKRFQRLAYFFYAFLYLHIMLIMTPSALMGKNSAILSVILYTAVFLFYLVWRVRKYLLTKKKTDLHKTTIGAFAVFALGMIVCLGLLLPSVTLEHTQESDTAANLETLLEQAEVFEGSAYGYDGDVYVQIYVLDGEIIHITGYTEEIDKFYFDDAAAEVFPAILETQSYHVDAVSGATYSSEAIMDSVYQAMRRAGLL